tara:strand:+ start:42 stop:596 length:555 start_codon:yes stop_codon:yes gene_type:complete
MSSNQDVEIRAEHNVNLKMLEGVHTGQVKWFNRRRGYGFIKILESKNIGDSKESFIGKDVFVHQSHIKPQKSSYRSLEENEYVQLGLSVDDKNVTQAVNVTGILGGTLLCDVQNSRTPRSSSLNISSGDESEFRTPKYHQRNNRNRYYRRREESPEETNTTVENSSEGSERRGNYFNGLSQEQH